MTDSQYPGYKMANQTGRFQIVPYSDFLLFSPERIAPTLRKFQHDSDPERQVIVEAVLDVVQSEEAEKDQWEGHWTTFMETGLHRVVVDILCEDKTYAAGVSEGYPAWTFVLLRRFGVWLSHKMKTDRNDTTTLAQVDEVLGLLPRLWTYTWTKEIIKHKAPFRMWRYKNEDEDLAISFIHTVDVMFNLYVMRHREAPPVTNHLGHLALYIWTFSCDFRFDDLMLRALILVIDTAEREELKPFFKEAVLDKDIVLPLHERFCSELLDQYNVNIPLRGVTSFLSAISVHCPPVLHIKSRPTTQEMFNEQVARKARGEEDDETTLMHCIRIACQRQICQAESDSITNSVLGASLSVIKDIMQDSLEPGSQRHLPAFFEVIDTAKIIPMVARITIHAIDQNDPSLFHCLQFILEMYGVSGETCRRTATPNVMSKIFAISRELWYPTVQEIRHHPIPLDNDQMAKMRDWALQVWLTFGKKLGFNERVEERRVRAMSTSQDHSQGLRDAARRGSVDATNELRRAQGVDNGWRGILSPFVVNSRMCHWKDCLCSWDEKPPHRMKVCKGCWRVWYCGMTCQARDWQDHRDYCLRHRERT